MKKIISMLLIAVALLSLCGCSRGAPENQVFSPSDLEGKQTGIVTDSTTGYFLSDLEKLGINVRTYTDARVAVNDVESGSLDCAIMDEETAKDQLSMFSSSEILDTPVIDAELSIVTALESASLLSVIDSTLGELIDDGIVNRIANNYLGGKEYVYKSPEDIEYSGTLKLAVNAIGQPFAFYNVQGELVGMDIDIARAVCDEMGVELTVVDAGGEDLYGYIRSGKADLAMGCLYKNDSTKDLVSFSQSYYTSTQVIVVRKK
ncbi:MAG: transporter substrate-binding domain-containing protein [Ruminococcaceae bacterium]|nr:transporter substrate-binding domain-containing protein [Oscillospiraceae bacterium]